MSLTVFPDLEQRSPEWYAARCGIVTASAVGKLLTTAAPNPLDTSCPECQVTAGEPCVSRTRKTPTPIKTCHATRTARAEHEANLKQPAIQVADNDTSRGLTLTLAAERIAGWVEETPITSDMFRGIDAEPIARDVYAENYGTVTEVGFLRRDEDGWTLGYSPDGLVGTDGLIEVKSPRAKTHVRTILADQVPAHYMAQLQAGLLVSGRAWCDFVSFVGGMPLWVKRVTPDPKWLKAIEAACRQFEMNASEIVTDYTNKVQGLPQTERLEFDLKVA